MCTAIHAQSSNFVWRRRALWTSRPAMRRSSTLSIQRSVAWLASYNNRSALVDMCKSGQALDIAKVRGYLALSFSVQYQVRFCMSVN